MPGTARERPPGSPADARSALARTAGARLIRRRERRGRVFLLGTDLLALLLAVALGRLADPAGATTALALAVVPLWLLTLAARGAYDGHQVGSGTSELSKIVDASVRVGLAVVLVAYLTRSDSARAVVFVTLPAGAVLLLLGRLTAPERLRPGRPRRAPRSRRRDRAGRHAPGRAGPAEPRRGFPGDRRLRAAACRRRPPPTARPARRARHRPPTSSGTATAARTPTAAGT